MPSTSAVRVSASGSAKSCAGLIPIAEKVARSVCSSSSGGIYWSIQLSTAKKRSDVGSLRTSTGTHHLGSGAGAGAGVPAYCDSSCTLNWS